MSCTDLNNYRKADIMACQPGQLVDLRQVEIDPSLPQPQRMERFLAQVGNPYLFRVDGIIIKTNYLPGSKKRLADAMAALLVP